MRSHVSRSEYFSTDHVMLLDFVSGLPCDWWSEGGIVLEHRDNRLPLQHSAIAHAHQGSANLIGWHEFVDETFTIDLKKENWTI